MIPEDIFFQAWLEDGIIVWNYQTELNMYTYKHLKDFGNIKVDKLKVLISRAFVLGVSE